MPTLYLSAPYDKSQFGSTFYKDFQTICQNGIGPDYAIYSTLIGSITPEMKVIVFDRVRKRQAEGAVDLQRSPQCEPVRSRGRIVFDSESHFGGPSRDGTRRGLRPTLSSFS